MMKAKTMTREEYLRLEASLGFTLKNSSTTDDVKQRTTTPVLLGRLRKGSGIKLKKAVKIRIMSREEYEKFIAKFSESYTTNPIPEGYVAKVVSARKIEL